MNLEPNQIRTCHECACGLINDDWSHIDGQFARYEQDECNAEHARIMAAVEALGLVSHVGEHAFPGYWDCAICGDIDIGVGHIFEREER